VRARRRTGKCVLKAVVGDPVQVIIDGRFVSDEADLHDRIAAALGYGPSYSHDLESLRERLAADDPRPLRMIWTHCDALRLVLGHARFDNFVGMLEMIEAQDAGRPWDRRFVFRQFE
jgi:RNAse (barnase) inhibitor barstar